jgi:hypothetical protein
MHPVQLYTFIHGIGTSFYTLGSSNDNGYQKEKKGQVRNCQKTQYPFSLMKNLLHSTGIL